MLNIDLSGKKALVTGGSRGIGRAIAVRLAQSGADVAINFFRQRQPADETARAIEEAGGRALVIKANVGDPKHIDKMYDELEEKFGSIDIFISNAASGVLKPFTDLTMKHLQWTMDINALALVHLAQHAYKLMREGGKIVAISSLGSVRAIPNYTAVGASKAALESLVRHLASELAPKGINVNAVSAGVVDTDALRHFPNRNDLLDGSRRRTPAGRLTTPDDVADVTLFLCSQMAKMIHGQTLVVDGGYSILG